MNEEPQPRSGDATNKSLDMLRSEIDALDAQLLALIEQRLALSASAAISKGAEKSARLRLRPRREADILDRLVARSPNMPEVMVRRVWRELMAFGLQAQGPLELLLHAPNQDVMLTEQTRARFGSAASIAHAADMDSCLEAARTREAVAIIELDEASTWWVALADDPELRIFDAIRDDQGRILALTVGRVSEEDSPLSPRFAIIAADILEHRRQQGEKIETLAAAGQYRLCISESAGADGS